MKKILIIALLSSLCLACQKENIDNPNYDDEEVFDSVAPKGAVDLGIICMRPDGSRYKLFWAECNIGANTPEEYGDKYAWGETEVKERYDWSTYKWANGDEKKITKYCPEDRMDYWDGPGEPDNKTVLDPEDDVAHVKLGGKWRMPTAKEWAALRLQCAWEYTSINGVKGIRFRSKSNGSSIFLPTTRGTLIEYYYPHVYVYPSHAYVFCIFTEGQYKDTPAQSCENTHSRAYGTPIRPVSE